MNLVTVNLHFFVKVLRKLAKSPAIKILSKNDVFGHLLLDKYKIEEDVDSKGQRKQQTRAFKGVIEIP